MCAIPTAASHSVRAAMPEWPLPERVTCLRASSQGCWRRAMGPDEAACLGVWLHATAGDLAARQMGQEAMLARDITVHLGESWSELHECLQTR